eukprot:6171951-Alexandrium_andersonii.AAC.1
MCIRDSTWPSGQNWARGPESPAPGGVAVPAFARLATLPSLCGARSPRNFGAPLFGQRLTYKHVGKSSAT